VFDPSGQKLAIEGESYPENAPEFYAPIFEWLDAYFGNPVAGRVQVDLHILYFNSSSSKMLMRVFDMLEDAAEAGSEIVVNWHYDPEDEAAEEYGEEFQEDLESVTFNMVELPDADA